MGKRKSDGRSSNKTDGTKNRVANIFGVRLRKAHVSEAEQNERTASLGSQISNLDNDGLSNRLRNNAALSESAAISRIDASTLSSRSSNRVLGESFTADTSRTESSRSFQSSNLTALAQSSITQQTAAEVFAEAAAMFHTEVSELSKKSSRSLQASSRSSSNSKTTVLAAQLAEYGITEISASSSKNTGLAESGLTEISGDSSNSKNTGLAESGITEISASSSNIQNTGLAESGLTEISSGSIQNTGLAELGISEISAGSSNIQNTGLAESGLTEISAGSNNIQNTGLTETSEPEAYQCKPEDSAYQLRPKTKNGDETPPPDEEPAQAEITPRKRDKIANFFGLRRNEEKKEEEIVNRSSTLLSDLKEDTTENVSAVKRRSKASTRSVQSSTHSAYMVSPRNDTLTGLGNKNFTSSLGNAATPTSSVENADPISPRTAGWGEWFTELLGEGTKKMPDLPAMPELPAMPPEFVEGLSNVASSIDATLVDVVGGDAMDAVESTLDSALSSSGKILSAFGEEEDEDQEGNEDQKEENNPIPESDFIHESMAEDDKDRIDGIMGMDKTSKGKGMDQTSKGKVVDNTSKGKGMDKTSKGKGVDKTSKGKGVDKTSKGKGKKPPTVITAEEELLPHPLDPIDDLNDPNYRYTLGGSAHLIHQSRIAADKQKVNTNRSRDVDDDSDEEAPIAPPSMKSMIDSIDVVRAEHEDKRHSPTHGIKEKHPNDKKKHKSWGNHLSDKSHAARKSLNYRQSTDYTSSDEVSDHSELEKWTMMFEEDRFALNGAPVTVAFVAPQMKFNLAGGINTTFNLMDVEVNWKRNNLCINSMELAGSAAKDWFGLLRSFQKVLFFKSGSEIMRADFKDRVDVFSRVCYIERMHGKAPFALLPYWGRLSTLYKCRNDPINICQCIIETHSIDDDVICGAVVNLAIKTPQRMNQLRDYVLLAARNYNFSADASIDALHALEGIVEFEYPADLIDEIIRIVSAISTRFAHEDVGLAVSVLLFLRKITAIPPTEADRLHVKMVLQENEVVLVLDDVLAPLEDRDITPELEILKSYVHPGLIQQISDELFELGKRL